MVTVTAVVRNQGEVSTKVNSITQLTSNNAGITINKSTTSILGSGDSTTLKWTYTAPVVSYDTDVTLTATADYTKVVIESNESNNTKTHSFMISPKIAISVGGDNQQYYINEEVVTPANVSSSIDIIDKNSGTATLKFYLSDGSLHKTCTVRDVVLPKDKTQVVWEKWETPDKPQTMTCEITWSASGKTVSKNISIEIFERKRSEPTDPKLTDTNTGFTVPTLPTNQGTPTWELF